MFLRFATIRRGAKTYRYAQLVESYRRESDGRPSTRILANLGDLDDARAEALKAAIAGLTGGKVTVGPEAQRALPAGRHQAVASRSYLDLAVLRRLWCDLGLDGVVENALPPQDRAVATADVILALVLQRCVAPAPKVAAEAWYATTALPELQGILPGAFNNSRIHRALAALDQAEPRIQNSLPALLRSSEGQFTTLFIDATDTWFVGQGPAMAHKGRDKEGIYRRRIGLVMLCDQRGFPLRWHTLDGRFHDPTSLAEMAREAAQLPWTRGLPLVMDRAAGHAGATQALHDLGVHYLTAIPDSELMSSGAPIPWDVVDGLQQETEIAGLQRRLRAASFLEHSADRYVWDLGVFVKARSKSDRRRPVSVAAIEGVEKLEALGASRAAAELGTNRTAVYRFGAFKGICPAARRHILSEQPDRIGLDDLRRVAALPEADQIAEIQRLQTRPGARRRAAQRRGGDSYAARAVVSFSPERFLEDRRKDQEKVAEVEAIVVDVNRRLQATSSRRTDASALAEVAEGVRKRGLGSVFSVEMTRDDERRMVVLARSDAAWSLRRRGDGINVIVAHPAVQGAGIELVERYFSKDAIEKDFQTIKSVTELRPIHHRTDPKVRAHVTLCVLALLLLRVLRERLRGPSAESVLAKLEEVRLIQLMAKNVSYYSLVSPSEEVTALVDKLGYGSLISSPHVEATLAPR
jgi:hypothetical protein